MRGKNTGITILTAIIVLLFFTAGSGSAAGGPAATAGDIPGTVPAVARAPAAEQQETDGDAFGPVVTEVGKISWSVDGLGMYPGTTGTIQVEKPAGATVRGAYMAAASTGWFNYTIRPGDITIDGTGVVFTTTVPGIFGINNSWADVTPLVKAKIDAAPPGRIDMAITEAPSLNIDGELLAVIFNDPGQATDNTIVLLFGAQSFDGDKIPVSLAEPISLSDPDTAAVFSLGSSFSYQEGGKPQYSLIDVNGVRMTSWAGGSDDGIGPAANGNLFTVGGLDDSTDNPADAFAKPVGDKRYDDELYSLLPFVADGDTRVRVFTANPDHGDNLLFAGVFIQDGIAVAGQGLLLSPASATNTVGTTHALTATAVDDDGNPVTGRDVTFAVISGPHAGLTGTAATDTAGKAQFAYTGTLEGTDTVAAAMTGDGGETILSNAAEKTWTGKSLIPLPGYTSPPTDPDHDGIYEDLNANGRMDFADVVLYFNQMDWIAANEPVAAFDLNGNGRIDFADIVELFNEV